MTPMQQQNNAVLNAFDEGRVAAVIGLYNENLLPRSSENARNDITNILITNLHFNTADVDYWLDWFGV